MEQKKKSIGTNTYLVTQMDAISALKIQTKIIKVIGPGAVSLIGGIGADKIKAVIPALLKNFDDEIVNEIVLSLFEKGVFIEINGTPKVVDFATHFAGNMPEMWKVVAFILEVNFAMGESIGSSSPTTEPAAATQGN